MTVQGKEVVLKSTSVDDKRPTPSQLKIGEISLGYNEAGAFLCCKDSAGNIQQVGGIRFSEDAPGTPVKGTLWIKPSTFTLYGYDGQYWLPIASGSGGGGSSAVSEIIAGDGIDVTPTPGVGVVTLDIDIDSNRGIEMYAGRLAIRPGLGLQFDSNGALEVTNQAMTYGGTVDLTSSSAKPVTSAVGQTFANSSQGTSNSVWSPDITVGTSVQVADVVVWNGSGWDFYGTGSAGVNVCDLSIANRNATTLDIDSSIGADATIPAASQTEAGLMVAADKLLLDNTWQRNGSILSPQNSGDDIDIGVGNITLNSTGSIVQKGSLFINRAGGGAAAPFVRMDNDGTRFAEIAVDGFYLGGGSTAVSTRTSNIALNINGTADFANTVSIGGTLPSAPAIELSGNGNGTFSDNVKISTINTSSTTTSGGIIDAVGKITLQRTSASNNTDRIVKAYKGSTESFAIQADGTVLIGGDLTNSVNPSPNIELNADGSSQYEGNLDVGDFVSTLTSVSGARLSTSGTINVQRTAATSSNGQFYAGWKGTDRTFFVSTNGGIKIGGTTSNSTNPKITLDGDGSASFKKLDVGTDSNTDGQVVASFYGQSGAAARGLEIKLGTTNSVENALVTLDAKQAAAGQLALATKGAEKLRIDNSGNIRIGGTLPSSPNITLGSDGTATFITDSGGQSNIVLGCGGNRNPFIQLNRLTGTGAFYNHKIEGGVGDLNFHVATSTTSTSKLEITSGGNVRIGSDVSATATTNIYLNGSDGSANFKGNITNSKNQTVDFSTRATLESTSGLVFDNTNATSAICWPGTTTNASKYIYWDHFGGGQSFHVGAVSSSNVKTDAFSVTLQGDGQFSGNVDVGAVKAAGSSGGVDSITAGTTTDPKFFVVRGNGTVLGSSDGAASTSNYAYRLNASGSAQFAGSVSIGGTLPSAAAITLGSDGSGTFGSVESGTVNTGTTSTNGISLNNGSVTVQRSASSPSGALLFDGYRGNTRTATISSEGAATFSGDVQSGGDPNNGSADGAKLRFGGLVQVSRPSSANTIFAGYTTGSSTPTSIIQAGGSAQFSGSVTTSGVVEVNRPENSTADVFRAYAGSTLTSAIKADGTGLFKGPVSIGGTAAGNTISDYESGFWTPSYTLRSPTGSPTLTTNRVGANANVYVKVGNLVTVFFNINTTDVVGIGASSGTANTIFIGTLPFSAAASMSGLSLGYVANFANSWEADFTICGAASGSTIVLYENNKTTNSKAFLRSESLVTGTGLSSTTNRLSGSLSYYTNQ